MRLRRLIPLAAILALLVTLAWPTPAQAAIAIHQDPIGSCNHRSFGPGDATSCVKLVQLAVNYSLGIHLVLDGIYGRWTTFGVMVWQQVHVYPVTGRIEPNQWSGLCGNLRGVDPIYALYAGC